MGAPISCLSKGLISLPLEKLTSRAIGALWAEDWPVFNFQSLWQLGEGYLPRVYLNVSPLFPSTCVGNTILHIKTAAKHTLTTLIAAPAMNTTNYCVQSICFLQRTKYQEYEWKVYHLAHQTLCWRVGITIIHYPVFIFPWDIINLGDAGPELVTRSSEPRDHLDTCHHWLHNRHQHTKYSN